MAKERVDEALEYARLGWRVVPLYLVEAGVCGCNDPACQQVGRHVCDAEGLAAATTEPATLRDWWGVWPVANIGLALGRPSGLVALDAETPWDRSGTLHTLTGQPVPEPKTVTIRRGIPSRARRRYLYASADPTVLARPGRRLGHGLRLFGDGDVLPLPPAHEDGFWGWDGSDPRWVLSREEGEACDDDPHFPTRPLPAPDWLLALPERDDRPNRASNQAARASEVYWWENHRLRSLAEVRLCDAFDGANVLFFPNAFGRVPTTEGDRKNAEADFLVVLDGKVGILQCDGDDFHPPQNAAADHEHDRRFQRHGIRVVQRYPATDCYERPEWVVADFLDLLRRLG